jgi:small subunit ribosomal protein S19
MGRSLWKGPFVDSSILRENQKKQKKNFKIWSRNSVIPEFLLGQTVLVHNGKEFKNVVVTREKLGYKFGEFSFTRKYKVKQNLTQKKKK